MNDVIKRYYPVISEREKPKDQLEEQVLGSVWDAEIRAAIWHIMELDRAFRRIKELNTERC